MIEISQIREARSIIDEYKNVEILKDVFEYEENFYMKISISINDTQNVFVPLLTYWYVKFNEKGADFFPAKENGINVTFQHQSLNIDIKAECPFLSGKLCLDRPVHIFDNTAFDYLSPQYINRFKWFLDRAIDWINKAAQDSLVADGDPFELPEIDFSSKSEFLYKENSLEKWRTFPFQYGYAKINKKSIGKNNYYLLQEIYDVDKEEARGTVFWGDYFENSKNVSELSMWIRLNEIPIQKPWMFPRTWDELFEICNEQKIDIKRIIAILLIKSKMISAGRFLALAFPIPQYWGGQNKIMSWIFIDLPEFKFPDKGFRKTLAVKNNFYLNKLKGKINYYDNDNFDSKYLLSRGKIAERISQNTTAIIGTGSLGSMIAEALSRIGFESIFLFDSDKFHCSNIARHTLNLDNDSEIKTIAVKQKIIKNNPNLRVKPFENLSSTNVQNLRPAKLIIDCSANNDVIKILSETKFAENKFFIIAAFGYGAKDLIIYFNKNTQFNGEEYKEKVIPIYKAIIDNLSLSEKDLIMQGIGCYHPVFPARFDEVSIWASMVVKSIERKYDELFKSGLIHLKITDLSVEVITEWTT